MHKRTVITAALVTFALVGGIAIYLSTIPNDPGPRALHKETRTPTATAVTATTSVGTNADDRTLLALAKLYTDAINRKDDATVARLNCAKRAPSLLQIAAAGQTVRLTGEIEHSPGGERAYAHLTIGDLPGPQMIIEQRDGAWCVRD